MLEIKFSGKMKKDLKRAVKRGKDPEKLTEILDLLARLVPLAQKHHDHALSGEWQGFRECHIENDWLLIYRVDRDALILTASRTGTHADFGW